LNCGQGMKSNNSVAIIQKIIDDNQRNQDKIFKTLLSNKIPHLSYSMIASFEFCAQKYFLQYVKQVRVHPEPVYFIKGTTFHNAAQKLYLKKGTKNKTPLLNKSMLRKIKDVEHVKHIENAVSLLIQNKWGDEWSVVDVERPFVMQIHKDLPPFFGIIDLVLSKGNQYVVIDHKTGKKFNELDALQLAFYREFVLKEYSAKKIDTFFDQYRWVNNLDRIRKPAFVRSKVLISTNEIKKSIKRAHQAYIGMCKMKAPFKQNDECYGCQFHGKGFCE